MLIVCLKLYFVSQVAGGLAGETPQMISAAVKGLARLAYEFSDLVSSACNVLPSSFLLLQRKNREIIKVCSLVLSILRLAFSVLGFPYAGLLDNMEGKFS